MFQQNEMKQDKVKARKKRKISPSLYPFSSSSSSSSSTESESEIVDKIAQTESPIGMVDYTNLQFKSYITNKDISEKILTVL